MLKDKTEENNKIKYRTKLEDLKSKYILKIIFEHLSEKNFLKNIQYNKILQQKLDININNYKQYSLKYSSIEIELVPVEIKFANFIIIKDPKNKKYFHTHFGNGKKEIENRTFLMEGDKVSKIKIIIDYQIDSFFELFSSCENIKSSSSLKEINIFHFNTNNITNFSFMFE